MRPNHAALPITCPSIAFRSASRRVEVKQVQLRIERVELEHVVMRRPGKRGAGRNKIRARWTVAR